MATWDSADDDPGETEEDDVNGNDVNDHDFNNCDDDDDATKTRIQRNKISAMLELIGKTVSCIFGKGEEPLSTLKLASRSSIVIFSLQ